jgi:hypothetical protein
MSDLRKAYLFIPMISVYISGMYYPIDDKLGEKVWEDATYCVLSYDISFINFPINLMQ